MSAGCGPPPSTTNAAHLPGFPGNLLIGFAIAAADDLLDLTRRAGAVVDQHPLAGLENTSARGAECRLQALG
jgi:hypothetical protein